MPILRDPAGSLDLQIREGYHWTPTFLQLVDDAVDENGDPVPFPTGTTAYLTVRDEIGGTAILSLGPVSAGLDGTLTVDAAAGMIEGDVAPLDTVGLAFPEDGSPGVYDLVIYPGGDATLAYVLVAGVVEYFRRATERPEVPSA